MAEQLEIWRLAEVERVTGLRRATLYKAARSGRFPKPIKLLDGGRASGWLGSEVRSWLAARMEQSRIIDGSPTAGPGGAFDRSSCPDHASDEAQP